MKKPEALQRLEHAANQLVKRKKQFSPDTQSSCSSKQQKETSPAELVKKLDQPKHGKRKTCVLTTSLPACWWPNFWLDFHSVLIQGSHQTDQI
jgi:hypothetical protein